LGGLNVDVPAPVPSRFDALSFWLRTRLLTLAALLRESLFPRSPRWPPGSQLASAPILAELRSPLWTDGRPDEFLLVAGKVQNLRVALRAFDGVEVPAGQSLSFWKQLGRPSAARGFVLGREIRQGCVVPTLAGGICQLSNALATLAASAGMDLVERHGHSARIERGADLGNELDATVFWRHIDLRLRADHAWRIEVALDAEHLIVRLRAERKPTRAIAIVRGDAAASKLSVARGCLSCGETQCFRHRPARHVQSAAARTAAVLDAWSPEFAAALDPAVERIAPATMRLAFWRAAAPAWPEARRGDRWIAWRRAVGLRLHARREGGRRQASILAGQRLIAISHARRLLPTHTRLIVDQSLLPHLEQLGVLAGREIVVLAHSLPMAEIEARLDSAALRWPAETSLRDYRAPADLVAAERRGFARAARVLTAHAEVAAVIGRYSNAELQRVPWQLPEQRRMAMEGMKDFVFAGGLLPRKGGCEMQEAMRALPDHHLRVVHDVNGLLNGAAAVVRPAHVEHSPRLLLQALAQGIPVIATRACGLGDLPGWIEVPAGDVEALRSALLSLSKGPTIAA